MMKLPDPLRPYFTSMERGCSKTSYVLLVKDGKEGELVKMLKKRCKDFIEYPNVFYRYKFESIRVTFYPATKKVLVEHLDEGDPLSELSRILKRLV